MKKVIIVVICCIALLASGCGTLLIGMLGDLESSGTSDRADRVDRDTSTPEREPGQGNEQSPGGSDPSGGQDASGGQDPGSGSDSAPPEAPSGDSSFPFKFTALDLYGNTVTEASLGDKEIFFVHYWATWCPPCIAEMPELGEVVKAYSDRVGFIGLLDDYDTSRDTAVMIKEATGAEFLNVDAYHSDFSELVRLVSSGYVPTTVLIDRDGRVIGNQLIGAFGWGYAQHIEDALNR